MNKFKQIFKYSWNLRNASPYTDQEKENFVIGKYLFGIWIWFGFIVTSIYLVDLIINDFPFSSQMIKYYQSLGILLSITGLATINDWKIQTVDGLSKAEILNKKI